MPAPGAPISHNPSQYPFIKDGYSGEYAGYVYDPYLDKGPGSKPYRRDKRAQAQYYSDSGLGPKIPQSPSSGDTLKALGTAVAVPAAAKYVGETVIPSAMESGRGMLGSIYESGSTAVSEGVSGGYSYMKGLLDSGSTASAASTAGSTGTTLAQQGVGLQDTVGGAVAQNMSTAPANMSVAPSAAESMSTIGGEELGSNAGSSLTGGGLTGMATNTAAQNLASGVIGIAGVYGMSKMLEGNVRTRNTKSVGMKVAQGASSGAAIGSVIPVIGTVIGGIVGAVAGLVRGLWKSGKHGDQYNRDGFRAGMEGLGLATKGESGSHEVTLVDGTKFDIGRDGGFKQANGEPLYNMSEEQMKTSEYAHSQGALMPLMHIVGGDDIGTGAQMSNYLTHAAMSSGNSSENIMKFYKDAIGRDDLTHSDIIDYVGEHYEEWGIDKLTAEQYQNALNYHFEEGYDKETQDAAFAEYSEQYFKDNPLEQELNDDEEKEDA